MTTAGAGDSDTSQHPPRRPSPPWPRIDRTSATDAAAREIRTLILAGDLAGGTLLHQGDLAEQLGLSRTPLREALQRLQAEGLLRIDTHRGAVVTRPTRDDVEQIYELQKILEPDAARWAAEASTPEDLEAVRVLLERHERSPGGISWMQSNSNFHMSIYRLARRPLLVEVIGGLRNRATLYVNLLARSPDERARADREHWAMYDALLSHDADRLGELVRQHLQGTLDWLQSVLPD